MNPHLQIPEVDTLTSLIPVFFNPKHAWRTGKETDPSQVNQLLSLTVWSTSQIHLSPLIFFLYPLPSRSPFPLQPSTPLSLSLLISLSSPMKLAKPRTG